MLNLWDILHIHRKWCTWHIWPVTHVCVFAIKYIHRYATVSKQHAVMVNEQLHSAAASSGISRSHNHRRPVTVLLQIYQHSANTTTAAHNDRDNQLSFKQRLFSKRLQGLSKCHVVNVFQHSTSKCSNYVDCASI